MVDKVTTVPKTKIGEHVGRFADEDMVRLNRAVLVLFWELLLQLPTSNWNRNKLGTRLPGPANLRLA